MHTGGRTQINYAQMQLRRNWNRFPLENHNARWREAQKQNRKIVSWENLISKVQNRISTLYWLPHLLMKLSPKITRPYSNFLPNVKKRREVVVTPEWLAQLNEINKALTDAVNLPRSNHCLMTDISFSVAGYAILIINDPNEKYTSP